MMNETMTDEQLFDRFCAPGVTVAEIAAMQQSDVVRCVREMLAEDAETPFDGLTPDGERTFDGLTAVEIAEAIRRYVTERQHE